MAGQRRGELRRHRLRGAARLGRLGLALSLLLILPACDDESGSFAPLPPGGSAAGGAGGTADGGGGAGALVGSWRNVTVVQVPGDVQTWTTTWRFDAGGACEQMVQTESLVEGFPRVTRRSCSYTTSSDRITVAFTGGGPVTFEFSFADFSPDRLVLDGFEYQRLA